MKSKFRKGDRVQGLDDELEGRVISANHKYVVLETPEGLELKVEATALIKLPDRINFNMPSRIDFKKEEAKAKKKVSKPRRKERSMPLLEVDLHIEKLIASPNRFTSFEILDIQMATAKNQIEFALRKRIQKVVLIHGVGEGVLKAELHTLLRRFEGITFKDAEYATYGLGATEVYIPQEVFR
jgi:dsDNA-specific endonuclease/ATPase MutS2